MTAHDALTMTVDTEVRVYFGDRYVLGKFVDSSTDGRSVYVLPTGTHPDIPGWQVGTKPQQCACEVVQVHQERKEEPG